jgi:hypothetical protein
MRSTSGQGTVEYVGVLLVIAVLMGAMVGGVPVSAITAGIASSIVRAALGGAGLADRPRSSGRVVPTQADRDAFARAVDPAVDPDDRPSLRDVRLGLIERHGDGPGRAVYRQLVLDDLRRAVPGLAGPTLFGRTTPRVVPPRMAVGSEPIDTGVALSRPGTGDAGEIETPEGEPDAHIVTVTEADRALARALHPGVSYPGLALDAFTVVPVVGNAARLAVIAAKITRGARSLGTAAGLAGDAQGLLAPGVRASPAGSREGDEIVTWFATRRPVDGGATRRFERTAVVRDGVAIFEGIKRADG